jgi:glycosyltransferase involved in cell wall biosynthesis
MSSPASEKHQPVSVVLITKNCRKQLVDCFKSLKPFLLPCDEVVVCDTGSVDGTEKVARKFGAKVVFYTDPLAREMPKLVEKYIPDQAEELKKSSQLRQGFLSDFSKARQFATDQAQHDLILWIDSDDILYGAKHLREIVDQHFAHQKEVPIFLDYWYWFESDGACTTRLWRERVFHREFYHWKGACHESAIPKTGRPPQSFQRINPEECRVEHRNHRGSTLSDIRNYAILRHAYETAQEKGEWIDPRWIYYLGNACRGMQIWDESKAWYSKMLRCSGSRDDRFSAIINIASICQIKGRPWLAMDWFLQALKVHPADPRGYFGVARCWYEVKRFPECLLWTQLGSQVPVPDTLAAVDPNAFKFYPQLIAAMALAEMQRFGDALNVVQELVRMRPDYDATKAYALELQKMANGQHFESSVRLVLEHAASVGSRELIINELKPEVRQNFISLQREDTRGPAEDITYLCGGTVEPWDLEREDIGGSEKMVIQLAKEWAKLGKSVCVYCKTSTENAHKVHEVGEGSIVFRPTETFNPERKRKTLIIWRNHGFLDAPLKADKILVDLHDVQDPGYYFRPRLDKVDGYIFKSEFHRETAKAEGEQFIVSRNGIDLSLFEPAEKRDLQKIVFCSSADRGLLTTLRIWAKICKGLPNATLHVFYGFTPLYTARAAQMEYAHFGDDNCERHMLDYSEECLTLMDQLPRVKFHGRVSWKELADHLSTAGIWLYPTRFPEISCMCAMEAQIAGAWPIVYPTGALPETVIGGETVNSEDEAAAAIRRTIARGHDLDPARDLLSQKAKERFDIVPLAQQILDL